MNTERSSLYTLERKEESVRDLLDEYTSLTANLSVAYNKAVSGDRVKHSVNY